MRCRKINQSLAPGLFGWVVDKLMVHKYILVNGVYLEKNMQMIKNLRLNIDTLDGCVLEFRPIVDRYGALFTPG